MHLFFCYGNCGVYYVGHQDASKYSAFESASAACGIFPQGLPGGRPRGVNQKSTRLDTKSEGSDSCGYPTLHFWTLIDASIDHSPVRVRRSASQTGRQPHVSSDLVSASGDAKLRMITAEASVHLTRRDFSITLLLPLSEVRQFSAYLGSCRK